MRAFVIRGPGRGGVEEVDEPRPGPGQVVVEVRRAGVCGTDVELFSGAMPYLRSGHATYPLRPGHEWAGTVVELGHGVSRAWQGAYVTGDTMLGCGSCERCLAGHHHVCADRHEIGIRGGWPGALAERVPVPAGALRRLPPDMTPAAAAMVEPAGSAWRAVEASVAGAGRRLCVWGSGTIGLLAAQFACRAGAEVDVVGVVDEQLALARRLGVRRAVRPEQLGDVAYDAAIDATTAAEVGGHLLEAVEPSGRVVLIGLAEEAGLADLRTVVLRDLTVVGILGASAGLDRAIGLLADGSVQTEPLVAAVVGLDEVAGVLGAGLKVPASGAPKVQVDPHR